MADSYQWLQELKAGDRVICDGGRHGMSMATIDSVTATFVRIGECKYRRKDGYRIGDTGWDRENIIEATEENLARVAAYRKEIKRKMDRRKLSNVDWTEMSDEVVNQVLALVFPKA